MVRFPQTPWSNQLSYPAELSKFLSSVERRAYKQALFAVHDEHSALDIVQDAMIKLAEKYGDKPAEELPMLFQRILQNTIRDHFRRQKVRNTWVTLFSALKPAHAQVEEDDDPLEHLTDADKSTPSPDHIIEQNQTINAIESAISELPARQREAFLLRYWEGYDTTETAAAMGCTEGSVKTHCSRAVHSLARTLKSRGITLT